MILWKNLIEELSKGIKYCVLEIILEKIYKKFQQEWIIKDFSYHLEMNQSYAITGSNGSGKSTLLKIISGNLPFTQGSITYRTTNKTLAVENIFRHINWVAPYIELIEEFTLSEMLQFHFQFKSLRTGLKLEDITQKINLTPSKSKLIRDFSSGMKQRLKLALAFYSDCQILLLDEPTTNLDVYWINWYQNEIKSNVGQRLIVISSNQPEEYEFCNQVINLQTIS